MIIFWFGLLKNVGNRYWASYFNKCLLFLLLQVYLSILCISGFLDHTSRRRDGGWYSQLAMDQGIEECRMCTAAVECHSPEYCHGYIAKTKQARGMGAIDWSKCDVSSVSRYVWDFFCVGTVYMLFGIQPLHQALWNSIFFGLIACTPWCSNIPWKELFYSIHFLFYFH